MAASTVRYYASGVVGDGLTRETHLHPAIADEPGVEGYMCVYEQPLQARAIVAVLAQPSIHTTLLALYDEAGEL